MDQQDILSFLENDMGLDLNGVTADSSLISSGLVDSFAFINLITFIEGHLGTQLLPEDITVNQFDTIEAILRLYHRKTSSETSP